MLLKELLADAFDHRALGVIGGFGQRLVKVVDDSIEDEIEVGAAFEKKHWRELRGVEVAFRGMSQRGPFAPPAGRLSSLSRAPRPASPESQIHSPDLFAEHAALHHVRVIGHRTCGAALRSGDEFGDQASPLRDGEADADKVERFATRGTPSKLLHCFS